ncbi:hypothetical protein QR680_008032 [Steinernema hermaphroditum]|uniref:BRCT domain-containing protein n=1 Tax=Steinernema hermaphroditum TaxID=289476 RepID=A0AA39IF30_9BILA|nr:hypothetical protein QR680_008032 [Steinernema hermaphroditum]
MHNVTNLTQNFSDDPTVINVVDLTSVSEQHADEDLLDAGNVFKALKEAQVGPRRITELECLQVTDRRGAIYILPTFDGTVFKHLRAQRCRIFGIPIVMKCLHENGRLPKEDFPVYSATLQGANICCTGLNSRERAEVLEKVRWMGGRFHGDLTDKVTHLIAKECDTSSQKYRVAVRSKLPVMKKDWMNEAWKRPFEDMTSPEVIGCFKLPIFSKLIITVSGLSVDSRNEMRQLIEQHGGEYSGEMKRGKCTHLVVDKTSGDKFRRAKQWDIKIVTTKWIQKCAVNGVRLDERHFLPGSVVHNTSHNSPGVDISVSSLYAAKNTFRGIPSFFTSTPAHSKPKQSGDVSRISKNLSTTHENLRVLSNEQLSNRQVSGSGDKNLVNIQRKFSVADPIENLDLSSFGTFNNCLDGCGVFVCGVTDTNMVKWKRMLNITGASRCQIQDIQSSRVTHIILGPEPVEEKLLQTIEKRSSVVAVVTLNWLLQCVLLRTNCPKTDYLHPMFDKSAQENFSTFMIDETRTQVIRPAALNDKAAHEEKRHSVYGEPRSQVIDPAPKQPTIPHEEERQSEPKTQVIQPAPQGERTPHIEEAQPTDETVGDASFRMPRLLQKKTFRFEGFSEDDNVEEQITDWGGVVLKESDPHIADFLIYPLLLFHANYVDVSETNAREVVSWMWLWKCQADQVLLGVEESPLFRPIGALEVPEDLFSGCVVALRSTGFHPVVYEELTVLLNTYGATLQKEIRTKDSNAGPGRRNTHVIVGKDCDRSAFAREKGIPVVDAAWIIESIIHKQCLPAEDFPFNTVAFKNYVRKDDAYIMAKPKDVSEMVQLVDHLQIERDEIAELIEEVEPEPAMEWEEGESHIPAGQLPIEEDMHNEIDEDLNDLRIDEPESRGIEEEIKEIEEMQVVQHPSHRISDEIVSYEGFTPEEAHAAQQNVTAHSDYAPSTSFVKNQLAEAAQKTIITPSRIPRVQNNGISPGQIPNRFEAPGITPTRIPRIMSNPTPSVALLAPGASQQPHFTQRAQSTCEIRSKAIDAAIARFQKKADAKPRLSEKQNRSVPSVIEGGRGNLTKRSSQEFPPEQPDTHKLVEPSQEPSSSAITAFHAPPIKWDDHNSVICSYPERTGQTQRQQGLINQSIKIIGSLNAQRIIDLDTPEEEVFADVEPAFEEPEIPVVAVFEEAVAEPVEEAAPVVRKVFYVTAIKDENLKQHCLQIIHDLGGEMDSGDGSGLATHLVTPTLTRSEKVLSAIARGLWILTPQYLFDSNDAGRFLEEDAYEHGQITSKRYKEGAEQKLAAACKRWRVKIRDNEEFANGAFSKWNVAVYGGSKAESVVRLVRLGGGKAALKSELGNSFRGITHVLVDPSNSEFYKNDLTRLVRWKIPCYKIEFTAQALMDHPLIEREYYASEYRRMLESGTVL